MKKKRLELESVLKGYLRWPLFLTLLLLVMDISIFAIDRKAGLLMFVYVIIYLIIAILLYTLKRSAILNDVVKYAIDYSQVQRQLLKDMLLPYALLDTDGHLLWGNYEFMDIIKNEKAARKNISNIFPELQQNRLPKDEHDVEIYINLEERNYRVVLRRSYVEKLLDTEGIEGGTAIQKNALISLYLYDETEIHSYMKQIVDEKMVVGLLYLDNYEEALEAVDEVRRSLLLALIDRKINKYMQNIDAIVKKLEKDKYIFIFKHQYLEQLKNTRFSLLEEVRSINIGNDIAVTLSMGLGVNEESYQGGYNYARVAIDLALGRGGDQAVVKEGEKISYYGGKSVQVEKKTRVKARVKAHALRELMEAKESVLIMGHKIGDVDSFGAAIGVYRIAKTLDKKAHIVINDITTSVRPIMNRFKENSEYTEDMFLNSNQAIEKADVNTLLVVVDVNRPNYTECEELLQMIPTIVVLDHHRSSGEAISRAVLSYVEPYASSACEMVAEVLQYVDERLKLRPVEAEAMYAGMMIDTNNFLTKTGVRTFEAAAYLRRSGADITRVRKMFRSDMLEYKLRAEAISHMEVCLNAYAITECKAEGVESPTILGAQVANELLDINNIKASFVLTEYNGKVYISARSIDEVNVQVVMEKLGGGGHMSVAGAQLEGYTIERAKAVMKETLRKMKENEEL